MKSIGFADLITDFLKSRTNKVSPTSVNEEKSDFEWKVAQAKSRIETVSSQVAVETANNATLIRQDSAADILSDDVKNKVTLSFTENNSRVNNYSRGSADKTSVESTESKLESIPRSSAGHSVNTKYAGLKIKSGQIGVQMNHEGVPSQFRFYDKQGNLYRETSFTAYNLLSNAKEFDIDVADLQGLGEQLDMLGIGYRPYELYSGTGSNHGIDFKDLMEGGLGTAYDWTIPRETEGLPPHAVRKERLKQEFIAQLNLKPFISDDYKTLNGD